MGHVTETRADELDRITNYGRPAWQMRTLYFCPVVSSFYLVFPRLISAVAEWMSTILVHMMWP